MPEEIPFKDQRPGVSFNAEGKAEILLWAPLAGKAWLVLNNTKLPLNQSDFGYWTLTTDALTPGDEYRFQLDDKDAMPDVASLYQPDGVHEASQAIDLKAFKWTDASWRNPKLDDYIIYELHAGTFSAEGDFKGITAKLDHLIGLGINAIEILPVAQFPGNRNWGYDGVFPYAVQNSYGGAEGFMQLINACHAKGLAVILDVVYNHIGPEGNYLNNYGPYFTDKYHTPWGNAINFDDAWCDGVRHYFTENMLMWFRDFHIDAVRMDAVHAIKDLGPVHILREIKLRANELMQQTGKTYHFIIEFDLNDPKFINPLNREGFGMDLQWIDEFHHALRVTAGGDKSGYYADFDGIEHLAKAYTDAYVYDGQWSAHRSKFFGIKADDNPGNQFIAFSQNHDQVGNRMLGERSSQLFSFEMQKLMAGAVLIAPYLPMLFMGEEWSATTPFQYFVSHTDPELVQMVRDGRKAEFKAFHTEEEAPDPQAEETFHNSKLNWDELDEDKHKRILDYYRALIALRKQLPALHILNRKNLKTTVDKSANTIMLHRWHADEHVFCFMNFSNEKQPVSIPAHGGWSKVFDSASAQWLEPGRSADPLAETSTQIIQPQSLIIYTANHV